MAITTSRDRYSTKPFAEALSDLLREEARGTDTKPNLTAFLRRVPGWRVDTLRKQVLAERTLQPAAVEAMAEVLNIAPSTSSNTAPIRSPKPSPSTQNS